VDEGFPLSSATSISEQHAQELLGMYLPELAHCNHTGSGTRAQLLGPDQMVPVGLQKNPVFEPQGRSRDRLEMVHEYSQGLRSDASAQA
jgi:hypothetical protein